MDKVISFRVPINTYIDLLKEAAENKMSMSDYMLIKLDLNAVKTPLKRKKSIVKTFSVKLDAIDYIQNKYKNWPLRGVRGKFQVGSRIEYENLLLEYRKRGEVILYRLE